MYEEVNLNLEAITADKVIKYFRVNCPILPEDSDKIARLPHWDYKLLKPEEMKSLKFWHFDPHNPNHVGQLLTDKGKNLTLSYVAKRYVDQFELIREEHPAFVSKIEQIREVLRQGQPLPAILLVSGRKPNSLNLVDGNNRALALMLESINDPENHRTIGAFVGRKEYPWEIFAKNAVRLNPKTT